MEFAEFIKINKLDRVIVTQPFKDSVEGSVCITGHHFIFSSRKEVNDELWVSLLIPGLAYGLILSLILVSNSYCIDLLMPLNGKLFQREEY